MISCIFSTCCQKTQKSSFMENCPVGAEFFHADGRTDGRTDGHVTKLIVSFRSFANAPCMRLSVKDCLVWSRKSRCVAVRGEKQYLSCFGSERPSSTSVPQWLVSSWELWKVRFSLRLIMPHVLKAWGEWRGRSTLFNLSANWGE
jgi:hypothetical protein